MTTDQPNPKYVMIDLYSGVTGWSDKKRHIMEALASVGNPTIVDVMAENGGGVWITEKKNDRKLMQGYLIEKLRAHVKRHGTINEIVIAGHGDNMSTSDRNDNNLIYTDSMLEAISTLQAEMGKQISKRIVFAGCKTFAELPAEQIEWLRTKATQTHMEIVGVTSDAFTDQTPFAGYVVASILDADGMLNGKTNSMRAVCFTPKGEVVRDKLDHRYTPALLASDDRSWVDYHLGHTQEQALKAMQQDVLVKTGKVQHMAAEAAMPKTGFGVYANNSLNFQAGSLAADIDKVDALNTAVGVAFSSGLKKAVVVTQDNSIHSFGGIPLHPMTEKERTPALDKLHEFLQKTTWRSVEDNFLINDTIATLNDQSPTDTKFTGTVLGNSGRMLIATETGAYEVLNMHNPATVAPAPTKRVQHGVAPAVATPKSPHR